MVQEGSVQKMKARLRGRLVQRGDEGYDDARKVYNGMIDKEPAYLAQCVDVADVLAAVEFGRETGLRVAVRGGGHSGPGLGTVDDGLVIDLGPMRGVGWIPPATGCGSQAAASGATWTTRHIPSAKRLPADSSRRPAWEG